MQKQNMRKNEHVIDKTPWIVYHEGRKGGDGNNP